MATLGATFGVVCGLKSEAELLNKLSVHVRISGANTARSRELAEELAGSGVRCLLSFGLCGALSDRLKVGDLLLANGVIPETDRRRLWRANPIWLKRVKAALPQDLYDGCHSGPILGTDRIITTANGKRTLARQSGALAVDMESHAVAEVAERYGLPFVILRACSDEAGQDLPPAALKATQADGSIKIAPVLGSLARNPGQLPGLLALGKGSKRAHESLRRAIDAGCLG